MLILQSRKQPNLAGGKEHMWEQCSVQLLGKTCLSAGKPDIFTADCEKENPSYILNSSKAYIFQIKENLAKERKKISEFKS